MVFTSPILILHVFLYTISCIYRVVGPTLEAMKLTQLNDSLLSIDLAHNTLIRINCYINHEFCPTLQIQRHSKRNFESLIKKHSLKKWIMLNSMHDRRWCYDCCIVKVVSSFLLFVCILYITLNF